MKGYETVLSTEIQADNNAIRTQLQASKRCLCQTARTMEYWFKRILKIMSTYTHLEMNETFIFSSHSKTIQKLSDYDFIPGNRSAVCLVLPDVSHTQQ